MNIYETGDEDIKVTSQKTGISYQSSGFSRTNVQSSKKSHDKDQLKRPDLGSSSHGGGELLQCINRRISQTDLAFVGTTSL